MVFSQPHWGRVGIPIWVLTKRRNDIRRCAFQRRSFRAVVLGKGVSVSFANRAIVPGVSSIPPRSLSALPRREGVPGAAPGPGGRGLGHECGHPTGKSRVRSRPPTGRGRGLWPPRDRRCGFMGGFWGGALLSGFFGSFRRHTLALRDPFATGLVTASGTLMHIWGRMGQGGLRTEGRFTTRTTRTSPPSAGARPREGERTLRGVARGPRQDGAPGVRGRGGRGQGAPPGGRGAALSLWLCLATHAFCEIFDPIPVGFRIFHFATFLPSGIRPRRRSSAPRAIGVEVDAATKAAKKVCPRGPRECGPCGARGKRCQRSFNYAPANIFWTGAHPDPYAHGREFVPTPLCGA